MEEPGLDHNTHFSISAKTIEFPHNTANNFRPLKGSSAPTKIKNGTELRLMDSQRALGVRKISAVEAIRAPGSRFCIPNLVFRRHSGYHKTPGENHAGCRMLAFTRKCIFFSLLMLGVFANARAGVPWLYECGTPEAGTAGAGFTARAQDAATAFGNPAGMTKLGNFNVLLGAMLTTYSLKFSVDSASFGGGNGGNAGSVSPGVGVYYADQILPDVIPKLMIGTSVNSYARGKIDYVDTWAGRFYIQDLDFITIHLNPVVAYPILDWLSIGAGIDAVVGKIKQNIALNNALDSLPDGQIRVDETNVGAGGDGGILVQASGKLRFGVTYRSPVKLKFRNPFIVSGAGPRLLDTLTSREVLGSEVNLDLTIPQQIQAGVYWELTDKLAIMADGNWQDWSGFGKTSIQISNTASEKGQLNDTWHAAMGLHYHFLPVLRLMGGFGFDSSPIDKEHRTPSFPIDRQFRYAGGVQWDMAKWISLGGTYEYVGMGRAEIDQHRPPPAGTLTGEYDSNNLNFITIYMVGRL